MANLRLLFPVGGVNRSRLPDEQPELTSPGMNNVRPFDVSDERIRGGQRPALIKWGAGTQIGDIEQPVVAMCSVSAVQ
ncbi:hypothetical protein LCGC14_0536220 [marine sediment metagenome]|uniref:Uncharacterized protein n=1 Tax=marine sediment metagenome TaxID=412755 RepID=A0A0F9RU84_9ZZZZ